MSIQKSDQPGQQLPLQEEEQGKAPGVATLQCPISHLPVSGSFCAQRKAVLSFRKLVPWGLGLHCAETWPDLKLSRLAVAGSELSLRTVLRKPCTQTT